jgi:hypothetical protein
MDSEGMRLPLPRLSNNSGVCFFESLMRHVSTDICASVLLDDWPEKGYAFIDKYDQVHFLADKYFGTGAKLLDTTNHLAHSIGALISGFRSLMLNETLRALRVNTTHCKYLSPESLEELLNSATEKLLKDGGEFNHRGEHTSLKD